MPEALMAMTTSPGPGVGSGNSRSSSCRLPRKTMPFMSVSFALVDESQERPPRAEPPQVLAERGDDAAGAARRAARGVRRDDHARVGPERVTRRQRLGIGHVEPRAPDQSVVQRRQEVVAVHDRAPCHVDEDGGRAHPPEEVAGEEVVRRFGERQGNDDDVREPKQLVQAVGLPDRVDAGLRRDVLDVHRQDAHPEAERTPRHLAPGAAETDDPHRQLVELALLATDRLAQAVVGGAQGGVDAPCEAEEQREGVLGQVDADLALLGCQDDVALDELGREDGVHPGADGVVVPEPSRLPENVGCHAAEQDLGVHDLGALARRILCLHEGKDPARQRAEIVDAEVLFGRVTPDVLGQARRLRYYHSIGAGVDAILSPELVESDVVLASEKGEVGIHLAEHAFALLLGLTRGVHTALRTPDYSLREPIRREQRELYQLTMGIVGFGGTGREVARRALGFGMGVLAVDIEDVSPEPGIAAVWKPDRLHELLGLSDVVVIALPLTKATHHLFTRDLFRRMRPSAILINITRGAIVYGDDLLVALEQGWLWGAGLDVTDPEPLPPGHPLWTHPRVIVTPHTAGGSPRRAGRVIATFCENLRRLRAGQPLLALIDKRKGY